MGENRTQDIRSPGDFIRAELKSRGWTQSDLARILDRPVSTINRIMQGKHAVLPEMAIALGQAFGNGAEVWLERESKYRLSLAEGPSQDVRRRAFLHELAPIRELQRRKWIRDTDDLATIEEELLRLFEIQSLQEDPQVTAAMRKAAPDSDLSPSQRAWCFRVKRLARTIPVRAFDSGRLDSCEKQLRKLAAYPKESRKVARVLAEFGIRFVVVEPLSGSKVDGTTMWLSEDEPVIGVSLRYDRIDGFWFTLLHEFSHVRHKDALSVDADLTGEDFMPLEVKPEFERRADAEAAAALIPTRLLDSFIKRIGPLYSKENIVQFAHRVKIHPGVIVGQLQHRGEIGWRSSREMLVKVRAAVTSESLTDGWGHSIEGLDA